MAQDYVPPATTQSTDSGGTSGQSAPVSPDYVPQAPVSQPYYAPQSGPPRYGAPPSVGTGYSTPSYPASAPLQGQIQQSQNVPSPMPPAQGFIPGYAQQAGTMSGGRPYFPPQYGGVYQARPAAQPFTPTPPLQSRVDKTEPTDSRPLWLPAHAYTNDAMVAPYHNMDIFFWDKRSIPNKRQWIRLSTSVSKYWRGLVEEPCMVLAVPIDDAPGNFTFQSQGRNGPRGWLQKIGTTNWQGFPMYRYWFDQR